jgi:MFS family permease
MLTPLKRSLRRQNPLEPAQAVEAALTSRRNFNLGVANGVLGGLLDPLSNVFVLTLFITRLDMPQFLVGLLPAISNWGGLLPQMVVAGKVRGKRRVKPWYRLAAIMRVIGLFGMSLCAALVLVNTGLVLPVFFGFYLLYAVGNGVSGIPFIEMVGKIVPDHRKGTFFGLRQFGSAAMAMLTSGIAGAVMAGHFGLTFPYNFAAMFAASTLVGSAVYLTWLQVREPDLEAVKAPETASVFRLGLRALRENRDYRLFAAVRLLGTFAGISGPFYLVFVTKVLQVPLEVMGLYMMGSTAVSLVGGLVWAPVANRAPRHKLVMISTALQFANAVCALLVITMSGAISAGAAPFVAAPVFLISSLAGSAAVMFNDTTLLSIAPAGERPTYFGFLNTLAGMASFVLPLGGIILDRWGYMPLFSLSTTLAAGGVLAAVRLSAAVRMRRAGTGVVPGLSRVLPGRGPNKAL